MNTPRIGVCVCGGVCVWIWIWFGWEQLPGHDSLVFSTYCGKTASLLPVDLKLIIHI